MTGQNKEGQLQAPTSTCMIVEATDGIGDMQKIKKAMGESSQYTESW